MDRIEVRNTCIIINDYIMGECQKLEDNFKIFDRITHKMYFFGLYYDEANHKLYLPAGIDLWKIRGYLNEKYFNRVSNHPYKMIDNLKIKCKPRDDQQKEALMFTCGIGDYENNARLNALSVNLNTGKGKTYVSIATICYFRIKSIIITYQSSLLEQWKGEILKYTNLNDSDIIQITGTEKILMILNDKSKKAKEAKIYLCTHSTLQVFATTHGWDKVYQLFEILGIGMKFYDEAHTNFENMLMIDFYTNVYKTFYLTATPGRSSFAENKIFQLSLKNVPNIDLFDENNDPHTSYVAIKWNSRPTPLQISKCKNKYGLDRMAYVEYLVNQPSFYEMLRVVMDLVIKCKGRCLFYIGTNDAILKIYHWMCKNYPEFIGDIGIFTSIVSKEDKINEKKKKLILSTTKSAGLGQHIEGLKMTIVLAEPFKSEILTRQSLGRTRDPNTVYLELVDMGFRYTRNYYFAKLPIFNKYASDVSDSLINDYELHKRSANIIKERTHYQESPIELYDKRFDFSNIIKEKPKTNEPICPIEFIYKEINPYI